MDAKTQFISKKPLAAWWGGVAGDGRFDEVLLAAGGVAFEACPSAEQRDGILRFKEILLTLATPDAEPVKFTSPGLHHDLDVPRRTVSVPEPEKKTTKKK